MVAPVIGSAVTQALPLSPPAAPLPAQRVSGFEEALAHQQRLAEATPPAAPAAGVEPLSPADRARIGLDLGPQAPVQAVQPGQGGDMILNGLSKLRGVFDAREARVSEIMGRGSTDATSLMAMQVEMVNFTLLVDVSSKLTGKTTQVFDTLMKGQ